MSFGQFIFPLSEVATVTSYGDLPVVNTVPSGIGYYVSDLSYIATSAVDHWDFSKIPDRTWAEISSISPSKLAAGMTCCATDLGLRPFVWDGGEWVDQTDAQLRGDISASDGAKLIGSCASIAELRAVSGTYDQQRIHVTSYYDTWAASLTSPVGGGYFRWIAASTATDDGGSVIAVTGASAGRWYREFESKKEICPTLFGAVIDSGVTDNTGAFNNTILFLSTNGGGTLKPTPSTYLISTSVLIPSDIKLDLSGSILTGMGSNILIKAAAVLSGVLTDITSEYGTSSQGAGTNFVRNASIVGGVLKNASIGIRGHRFNYGTNISKVIFSSTLATAWYTTHSWGLKIDLCTVYCPATLSDFVDWTEICGNSFEGSGSTVSNAIGLTIQGSYGGSYSLNIHNNGFHHLMYGIKCACEMTNTVISSNHFEDTVNQIYGDSLTKRTFKVTNNWMKANLLISAATVIPIYFGSMIDSEIGPNYYSTDGASSFSSIVSMASVNCIGNDVWIPYSATTTSTPSLTGYSLSGSNKVKYISGSNDGSVIQPTYAEYAGNTGYTFEKYKSSYNSINNTIPFCSVVYSGTTVTLTTQVGNTTTYGSIKLCKYNFRVVSASSTIVLAGFICMNTVTQFCNVNENTGAAGGITITPTVVGGVLVLTLTGAPSGGAIRGWIKEE